MNKKEYEAYYNNCNKRSMRKHVSSNIVVYRLENEDGEGPFKTLDDIFKEDARTLFKPSKLLYLRPDQDFDIVSLISMGFYDKNYNRNFRFAFSSIAQIKKWMNESQLNKLKERGYKINKYKTGYALMSDNQCIFDIRNSIKL